MNITVTKEDIEHGLRRDPEHCAIARALMRAGLDHFGVMGPSVMVADGWGRLTSLRLPEVVSDWIFNFDAGNPVGPLRFELDLPERPLPERTARTHQKAEPLLPDLKINSSSSVCQRSSRRTSKAPRAPRLASTRNRGLGFSLKVG